ncbi:hypothetical protein [Conexibacter sp. CPCC 206217]|uniref:hypothetical protein n=1 Tax=Conexibacter sp. CPCC 206217 TaxID=3064574 RepID=UPI00271EEC24|nr:hypothetical protein [Conexibacter sp. CPCC 206217]MDO8209377.1 hypothetical protein [Conexibacter sp. CPCC 206217]
MNHRVLEHRARAVVALLLALLAAVTLAACGSDDKDSSGSSGGGGGDTADAQTLLRETFSGTKDVRSGRFALSLRAGESGGEQIAVSIGGPFESIGGDAYPKFAITAVVRGGGLDISGGLTSTSDRLYVEYGGNAYEVPAEYLDLARQQTGTQDRAIPELPDFDPLSWVTDPTVVGTEDVGGVETQHISAGLNVTALMDSIDRVLAEVGRQGLGAAAGGQVPSSIPADTRAQIERAVRDPRVDIWTGSDDKTLRKLQVDTGIEPEAGRSGTASFSLELSDLNEAQTIEPPANTRPIDELLGAVSGLLGSAVSPGTDSGGNDPSASSDALGEYQRCVVDAGSDVAKVQQCTRLLQAR